MLVRDHTVLPATDTFIQKWNEPSCLYSLAAEHHRTLAGTHFLFANAEARCWVGLDSWLHTEVLCTPEDGHPSLY